MQRDWCGFFDLCLACWQLALCYPYPKAMHKHTITVRYTALLSHLQQTSRSFITKNITEIYMHIAGIFLSYGAAIV